jgi:hypothetical protein
MTHYTRESKSRSLLVGDLFCIHPRKVIYVKLDIEAERLESVEWRPGQATSMTGHDMKDWHVALWYDHRDSEKSTTHHMLRKPDQDVYIVGEAMPKEDAAALGTAFVSFLRAGGNTINPDRHRRRLFSRSITLARIPRSISENACGVSTTAEARQQWRWLPWIFSGRLERNRSRDSSGTMRASGTQSASIRPVACRVVALDESRRNYFFAHSVARRSRSVHRRREAPNRIPTIGAPPAMCFVSAGNGRFF